jgi:hypothetical protein
MKNLRSFLATLLAAIIPALSFSQWSTSPAVNNAINTLSGEQAIPKIATCPSGDTYIASFSNEGGNYNVRLQRLDAQGNALWATNGILISDNPQMSWLTDWDMTADASNHAILTFQDIRNGGNNNVVAYRISPSGTFVWGDDGIALSNSTAFNAAPKVCVTAAGNAVFAWQADEVVIMQKVSPSGSLLWGTSGITLSGTATYSWPQLLPVGADEVILKYFIDTGSFPALTRHIYAQRFNSSGTAVWSSATTVSNAGGITAWTQVLPFINDGQDGFFIAWHDQRYGPGQPPKIYVHRINSAGQALFTANGVEASSSSYMLTEAALALPPGSSDVYVFYNEIEPMFQSDWGVSGQKISSSGSKLWGVNGISFIPVTGTQVYIVNVRNTPTDVVLFYEEYVGMADMLLKAARINTSGGFVWTPSIKAISTVVSEKVHPEVNEFANNQWILAWEDDRNGDKDIFAQNIQLGGDLGPYDPQEGTITGNVTLIGGTASVTLVNVTAGAITTHPASNGNYSMVVPIGTYNVIGSLQGYIPDTVFNVVVTEDQTTSGVNLVLEVLPTGTVTGNVQLNGGNGNVTQVTVFAGYHSTHPDIDGNYSLVVEIGSYDMTAELGGYFPDSNFSVTVLANQTTADVDFVLDFIPVTGFITGTVELENNAGDVTQAVVTAGTTSTHPDANGDYMMEVPFGIYEVTAGLEGFYTQVQNGIVVIAGQTTVGVDFFLLQVPDVGYIDGYVTLVNGNGAVTEAVVEAGGNWTHPGANGHYFLSVPAGVYTVYASHPYALPDSVTGVEVANGASTSGVNFELEIVRGDLACMAMDTYGTLLNDIGVEISGPEGMITGTILNDSLVFDNLPYGDYTGTATMEGEDPVYQNTTLGAASHHMIFVFDLTGITDNQPQTFRLSVFPNPFNDLINVEYYLEKASALTVEISDIKGNRVNNLFNGWQTAGKHQLFWQGNHEAGNSVPPGFYVLIIKTSDEILKQVLIKR